MRVAIHQPQYFPWPPYFHKVLSADVFIYLDTVQFSKNGFQNRNQVRTAEGPCWLTLPVRHRFGQTLRETRVGDPKAFEKHLKTLASNYARTEGYKRWRAELEALLVGAPDEPLAEVGIRTTRWLLEKLGGKTKTLRASELPETAAKKNDLILELCARVQATTYLSGSGGAAYVRPEGFRAMGCEIVVQECGAAPYPQAFPGTAFVPGLSALDLVLNRPDDAREIIERSCRWRPL